MRTLLLGAVIPEREVRNHQREIESELQHFHLGMPSSTRVHDLRHFLPDDTNWPPLAPSAVVPRTSAKPKRSDAVSRLQFAWV